MRIAPFPPEQMPADLRRLHDDMAEQIDAHLKGFVSRRDDGALVGPFAPMLRFAQFGSPAWAFTKALIEHASLPKRVREVAILAVGAAFDSRYELYAHEHVAEDVGLEPATIAAITAGQRPAELTAQEAVAYDVATVCARGRQLPQSTWDAAVESFGEDQAAELVYLTCGYALVSILLNAFDVAVPGRD